MPRKNQFWKYSEVQRFLFCDRSRSVAYFGSAESSRTMNASQKVFRQKIHEPKDIGIYKLHLKLSSRAYYFSGFRSGPLKAHSTQYKTVMIYGCILGHRL